MDGLSGASSVIAVVSVAIQLAEGIKDIVELCKAIKATPADVDALCYELELLNTILLQVQKVVHQASPDSIFDNIFAKASRHCTTKIIELQKRVVTVKNRLQSAKSPQRKWVAFKYQLVKPEIKSLQEAISDAKTSFSLVNQGIIMELQMASRTQQEIFFQRLDSLSFRINLNNTTNAVAVGTFRGSNCRPPEYSNSYLKSTILTPESETKNVSVSYAELSSQASHLGKEFFPSTLKGSTSKKSKNLILRRDYWHDDAQTPLLSWNIHHLTSTLAHSDDSSAGGPLQKKRIRCAIYSPRWLHKLGINYGIYIDARYDKGWQCMLQPHNILPADALIFEFCRVGNLAGVRSLFKRGEASPYDRDPTGRTALWLAAQYLHVDVVEFLLSEGADPVACNFIGRLPTGTFNIPRDVDHSPLKRISLLRLLQNHNSDVYDEVHIFNVLFMLHRYYRKDSGIAMSHADRDAAIVQVFEYLQIFYKDHLAPFMDVTKNDSTLIELMWSCSGPKLIRWAARSQVGMIPDYVPVLVDAIRARLPERDPEAMRLIIEKTQNLHFRRACPTHHEGNFHHHFCKTATDLAMQDSNLFFMWRKLLRELGHNIEDFIRGELEVGPLKKEGWSESTLMTLFEYDYTPQKFTGPSLGGYPFCERCGHGWNLCHEVQINIEFRRLLREIRTGRLSHQTHQNIIPYTHAKSIAFDGRDREVDISKSTHDSTSKMWPYRIVCPRSCEDGIAVGILYENDRDDDPPLPPYIPKAERERLAALRIFEEGTDEDSNGDEIMGRCPTQNMPGAWQD